jgi:hypothetical protein
MKARLLLTSALFVFMQIPAPQAQVTVDVSTITCQDYLFEKVAPYNGERRNTIIEPEALKKNEDKVNLYCYEHRDTTVMDAAKNVLGLDK